MEQQITPETLSHQAIQAYEVGEFLPAAQKFKQAAQMYRLAGEMQLMAEMQNNCSVALLKGGQAQEAFIAAEGTERLFAEAGDEKSEAMSWGNQAAALEEIGEFDRAIDFYQNSARILKKIGDKEMLAFVLKNLSGLQVKSGRQLEALYSMESALEAKGKLTLREQFLKKLLSLPVRMLHWK